LVERRRHASGGAQDSLDFVEHGLRAPVREAKHLGQFLAGVL